MANYNSTKAQAGVPPKWLPEGRVDVVATYAFPSSGGPTLGANDTITFMTVPAGVFVTGVVFDTDPLDSGTSSLTGNVGDATTAARYLSTTQLTTATLKAGGVFYAAIAGTIGYSYAANTPILFKAIAGAANAVPNSSVARLCVSYTADP